MHYLGMFRPGNSVRTRVLLLAALAILSGLVPGTPRPVQAKVYEPSGTESRFCADLSALLADREEMVALQQCLDDRIADNPTIPPAEIVAEINPLMRCTQRQEKLLEALAPPQSAVPAVNAYASWLAVYEDSLKHRCSYCRALDESLQDDGMLCGRIERCLRHDELALRERRLATNLYQVFVTHLERTPELCP